MRILHVIPSVNPADGGPVEGLKQMCAIYHAEGHEVDVACLDSPATIAKYNFPTQVFGLGPGWGTYSYSSKAVPWFKANIHRYDVVVINCIWQYNTLAAYRALAGTGIPFAVFTHGMLDPYFKIRYPLKHVKKVIYWHLVLRRILKNAETVFFTCEEEKLLARQSFSRYQVHETVVPYGTFGPAYNVEASAQEFLDRWPNLRGKRLAISLGRIHPKKGQDILIEAFSRTLAQDPSWRLVIAGPDQIGMQKDLEALAARLGVADRITWTGMIQGKEKWGAFAASEVFVLPSHQENFGVVVAEALACNLPVVISDKVNIWREIVSYWAGLVSADTLEGTENSLRRWSQLTEEEIAAVRVRCRKCFDDLFNYQTGSKKMLESIEMVARVNPSYKPRVAAASTQDSLATQNR